MSTRYIHIILYRLSVVGTFVHRHIRYLYCIPMPACTGKSVKDGCRQAEVSQHPVSLLSYIQDPIQRGAGDSAFSVFGNYAFHYIYICSYSIYRTQIPYLTDTVVSLERIGGQSLDAHRHSQLSTCSKNFSIRRKTSDRKYNL